MARWLAIFGVALGAAAASGGEASEAAPNVVVILADDVGWGDFGFNGRSTWQTPRLDELARRGVRFERFYTGGVVCAPSRAVLLTGRYTIHNGVSRNDADLPAAETTLAEALKARGYATALFGKWHHGRPRGGADSYVHPMDQGFDEFFGFTNAQHAWEKFPKELWDGRAMVPVSGYADDLFVERAERFLERRREDGRPFFLYLPLISGHFHVEAPADELARQRGRFAEKDDADPRNAAYAAMIERFDRHVGRVADALERLGLEKNTLVLVTSDHGASFEAGNKGASAYHDSNAPFRGQKRTLWEGGIRVPTVAVWPGTLPAGAVVRTPQHMADVFPTVLGRAGIAGSGALDGRDQWEVWTGGPDAERTLFWEWRSEGFHQVAAMRGDWKLVITRGGRSELFHVPSDPEERIDRRAEMPELVGRLEAEITAWLATEEEASREPEK